MGRGLEEGLDELYEDTQDGVEEELDGDLEVGHYQDGPAEELAWGGEGEVGSVGFFGASPDVPPSHLMPH